MRVLTQRTAALKGLPAPKTYSLGPLSSVGHTGLQCPHLAKTAVPQEPGEQQPPPQTAASSEIIRKGTQIPIVQNIKDCNLKTVRQTKKRNRKVIATNYYWVLSMAQECQTSISVFILFYASPIGGLVEKKASLCTLTKPLILSCKQHRRCSFCAGFFPPKLKQTHTKTLQTK